MTELTFGDEPSSKSTIVENVLLDMPNEEIDKLWAKEVEDRIDAYDQGKMKVVSLEKVLEKYR